jgi:hypothetical protein
METCYGVHSLINGSTPLYWALAAFSVSYLDGYQLAARPLSTQRTEQTQNKRAHTSIPRVEFEPTILTFERTTIVRSPDCAATVMGLLPSASVHKGRNSVVTKLRGLTPRVNYTDRATAACRRN